MFGRSLRWAKLLNSTVDWRFWFRKFMWMCVCVWWRRRFCAPSTSRKCKCTKNSSEPSSSPSSLLLYERKWNEEKSSGSSEKLLLNFFIGFFVSRFWAQSSRQSAAIRTHAWILWLCNLSCFHVPSSSSSLQFCYSFGKELDTLEFLTASTSGSGEAAARCGNFAVHTNWSREPNESQFVCCVLRQHDTPKTRKKKIVNEKYHRIRTLSHSTVFSIEIHWGNLYSTELNRHARSKSAFEEEMCALCNRIFKIQNTREYVICIRSSDWKVLCNM